MLTEARVLDFDGSVSRQREFVAHARPSSVDFSELGPRTRLWASRSHAKKILRGLDPAKKAAVTFTGSGDFHFVSALLLSQFRKSISLVVLDHHPDWDVMPPRLGCGAWISRAIEQENVLKVLHVGSGSDDLQFPALLTANWRSLRQRYLTLLPSRAPSSLPRPLRKHVRKSLIENAAVVFREYVSRLPTEEVYLSIDKDCLKREDNASNWEEGSLSLDQVLEFISILREERELVGADVTGEYSKLHYESPWKRFCSRLDHPRQTSADGYTEAEIDALNGRTNRRLFDALTT